MRILSDRLLEVAEDHDGAPVTYDEVLRTVFGMTPETTDALELAAAKQHLHAAIQRLRKRGRIETTRGAFALAPPLPPESEPDEAHVAIPSRAMSHASAAQRLNRLVMVVNAALAAIHEEISETRRALNLAETTTEADERPSFPMRCAEPWEREA